MTDEQRLQHNAEQNEITLEQAKRLDHYMSMKMSDWPIVLQDHCKKLSRKTGFCGETAVQAVCNCLKDGRIS